MFKKMIAMLVILAMLVPVSSVVAADEPSAQPTVEEILNQYHQKAFAAKNADQTGASTYARGASGSEKTLEQETVDQLTEAGYEAYNVTNANYETLEESLQTDFAELGMDPSGSYIVVLSGEDGAAAANSSRASDLFLPPHTENDGGSGGGDTFLYVKDGVSYTMRYVTITSLDQSCLYEEETYVFSDETSFWELIGDISEIAITTAIDEITKLPLSTVYDITSLLAAWISDTGLESIDPEAIILFSSSRWTRSYIQVRNPENNNWHTSQCSSYVVSKAYCDAGLCLNEQTGEDEATVGPERSWTTYSPFYHDASIRKDLAVRGYLGGGPLADGTGDIHFYFVRTTGEWIAGTNVLPLFTHEEDFSYLLPLIQEGS